MQLSAVNKWLNSLGFRHSSRVLVVLAGVTAPALVATHVNAEEVERPSIWVKNADRQPILDKIQTQPWAASLFNELQERVAPLASEKTKARKKNLEQLPLIWFDDRSLPPTLPKFRMKGGGSKQQLTAVIKALQDGVDCGVMYYLTQQSSYAACGADILYTYINALKSMELQKKGPMNSGWMFPTDHLYEARVIGAQLPIIYDFVYPYLKSGGKVYDLASGELASFDFDDAQNTFKTYIWLALNRGLLDSNWPVLESSSLVHNILALDNKKAIQANLPYYTHQNTSHQASLKMVAKQFAKEGDIWPESLGYSRHVAAFSIYLMTLLDRYDPALGLGATHPNIPAAYMSYYNLKFPNEEYPFFGDGHRSYTIEYPAFEMAYLLARLNNNQQQAEQFGDYLASSLKAGVYDRGHLEERRYRASPYYTPTQLLWYTDTIEGSTNLDVAPPRPRTKRLEFAGMTIQRNTHFDNPVEDSLMAFIAGGSYIHGHASGMDMELYGQGHVLGIDGGKGTYRTDIHENYYRLFAAHNSVISNGASASHGGWINMGISKVESVVTEPAFGEPGVSPNHSFTTSSFDDKYNLVAPATHQRTLALIKVSDTQGYYLDIFKAKSDTENQYHDYVYHNIGDALSVTSNGKKVVMKNDADRYQASAKLPWVEHKKYRHPGWHFFDKVKTYPATADSLEATFTAAKLGDKTIAMRALIPAGVTQDITQALAPKAYGAAPPYNKAPLPTLVLRKQGEAWSQPFVVAYESATEGEKYAVQQVERLEENGQFRGVKVTLRVAGEVLTQYVIAQDTIDDQFSAPELGIDFQGRFAVITINADNRVKELYLGSGQSLSYNGTTLTPPNGTSSAYRAY
ncbi:hypothetical protein DXV75_15795 [Alteromonas aestuariivivens]|uniref:Heparinase n=1 Tax=Alteromonas aestuariivivens TaxID=1938339 RepID=A0A3D8M3F3_9ALTE|nr:heparinase II/III family protein [Alteromonas aestuariivivens]RDV24148.1 hypothetical protein DXV75_15795 [Alteromonas aestuariivivens]